jgi:hypothetical protein
MAARQARLEARGGGLVLRDLESLGGTFVNRRRLLPDQDQPLKDGDLIQLGGVQLRIGIADANPESPRTGPRSEQVPASVASVRPRSPTPPSAVPPSPRSTSAATPLAFTLGSGSVCRDWDDFLTVSAQRWREMREELTSGRLAAYLISTGRAGLAPRADAAGSPDERLDAWLGALPVTRPARPELDVHPRTLAIRGTPGARVRRSFRVANVGLRLLKSRVRLESADSTWIRIPAEYGREFPTVEETEVPVEIAVPDRLDGPQSASIVVESNGGSARLSISIEPARAGTEEPAGGPGAIQPGSGFVGLLGDRAAGWLGGRNARARLIGGGIAGIVFRMGIGLASGLSGVALLPGPAAVLSLAGALAGGSWAGRRGGPFDAPAGAFAGGFAGLIAAAVAVAMCQAIEPILGVRGSQSLPAVTALWGALGAAIGGASLLVVPARAPRRGGT